MLYTSKSNASTTVRKLHGFNLFLLNIIFFRTSIAPYNIAEERDL